MKIRFQADADLNEEIVAGVIRRESVIDFQTAEEANLRGYSDAVVLAIAAQENRMLVSHDRRTMPKHFAEFIAMQHSPGVIIVSQNVSVRDAIEELLMIWVASEAEEWINTIVEIPL
jgi:predicted nuclease of predicted toxin-antitoxin system